MKVYGALERAQLETNAADPTVPFQLRWNSTSGQFMLVDAANARAMLRNDGKAIIGNSGTASENVRLHRGAVSVLQLVPGDDTTAEGTPVTTLQSLDARAPAYTDAGKPAAGNPGRVIWNSTYSALNVDTGAAWNAVGSGGGVGAFLNFYPAPGNGPAQKETVAGLTYWEFVDGYGEILWGFLKVPESYQAGKQIKLAVTVESDEAGSAELKFQAQTYLIRSGTDAMSSTTNSGTAEAAYSPASVFAKELVLNLTDASGEINSVAVSAGDILKIALSKPTDASTENLRVFQSLVEVRI
jgi:hypothetical protein